MCVFSLGVIWIFGATACASPHRARSVSHDEAPEEPPVPSADREAASASAATTAAPPPVQRESTEDRCARELAEHVQAGHAPPPSGKPAIMSPNACKGFFPKRAVADEGTVSLLVSVAANGVTVDVRVLQESPVDQGFGTAATACVRDLCFYPAVDAQGAFVANKVPFRLHFTR